MFVSNGSDRAAPPLCRDTAFSPKPVAGYDEGRVKVVSWKNSPRFDSDLAQHFSLTMATPARVFLAGGTNEYWQSVSAALQAFPQGKVRVKIAYSMKTNPGDETLSLARSCGFLAEAISQLEVDRALGAGFVAGEIVLNGPGKWWPRRTSGRRLRAVFCDSLVELRTVREWVVAGDRVADVVGIRLRPPQFTSRFGIPVTALGAIDEVAHEVARMPAGIPFGIHFHLPSGAIGVEQWWSLVGVMLDLASAIQGESCTPVQSFDIGGGWLPDDWVGILLPRLPELIGRAAAILPELSEVLLEPGRALAQPAMAMIARVLEVRTWAGHVVEIVIDASIAELPETGRYPHPVLVRDRGSDHWVVLSAGPHRVLGRSCMEADILMTDVLLPQTLLPGDFVAIADAGAYDHSKSYTFGCG